MTSLSSHKLSAFTYIEISVLLCSMAFMMQGIAYSRIAVIKRDQQTILQKNLFILSNTISQSLIVLPLNQDYQARFRQEKLSPFYSGSESLSTIPMGVMDFLYEFHIVSPEIVFDEHTKIVCFQKKRDETNPPTYHYVIYAYQDQDNQVIFGFASFDQHE